MNTNSIFKASPKIIRADRKTTITITSTGIDGFIDDKTSYKKDYSGLESNRVDSQILTPEDLTVTSDSLSFTQHFSGEQEHCIKLTNLNTDETHEFRFYSLEEDLFERKPYKGDLHMHSNKSDGKEDPGYVAASCRKIGLDFMALTDHHQYAPSLEAISIFEGLSVDMLMLPGEEVHLKDNPVHIINFGGEISVNDLATNESECFQEEVKAISDTLDTLDEETRYQCAASIWAYEKIREHSGLSIFCHPYWQWGSKYYISDSVLNYMYEHQPYDANEVIGGFHSNELESNALQIARYYEERSKGKDIPIVGVSDAHGCDDSDLFGCFYTVVFARTNTKKAIISSIKDLYSVAIDAPHDERFVPVGPFRLVKYTHYLQREIFPSHDALCLEEGLLMVDHLNDDEGAGSKLAELSGRVEALYDSYWDS